MKIGKSDSEKPYEEGFFEAAQDISSADAGKDPPGNERIYSASTHCLPPSAWAGGCNASRAYPPDGGTVSSSRL